MGLRERAAAHASQGDYDQARVLFCQLVRQDPADVAALIELSYVESLSGSYRQAVAYARQAAENVTAADAKSQVRLFPRLRTFKLIAELQAVEARLGPLHSIPIPVLLTLGSVYSQLNDQTKALHYLDEALRADPDYPPTLAARGQVLTYIGDFAGAEAVLEKCAVRAPVLAYWPLARVRRQTPERNHVAGIRKLLAHPQLPASDRCGLQFALHKELDDLGRHEEAWAALDSGCRIKRSLLPYDRGKTIALFDALSQLEPVHGLAATQRAAARTPIFIVGMHRSGTTLLEQVLDGHPAVAGVGEVYDFTCAMREATDHHCPGVVDPVIVQRSTHVDWESVGETYLRGMEWRLGAAPFFTDKLPSNFLNIGFICRALPQAKVLHMVRDPMETCFSNLRELFSDANPYSYDQADLADYHARYLTLMRHWHAAFPGRILDVHYAELTSKPESEVARICDFLGVQYEPEMINTTNRGRGIATASAVQVRGQIASRKHAKWLPYARYLQPLQSALAQGAGGVASGA